MTATILPFPARIDDIEPDRANAARLDDIETARANAAEALAHDAMSAVLAKLDDADHCFALCAFLSGALTEMHAQGSFDDRADALDQVQGMLAMLLPGPWIPVG